MKKLDIRVIGGLEIDMNMLTDKANERVEQLLLAHAMLEDKVEYLIKTNKVSIVDNTVFPFALTSSNGSAILNARIEKENIMMELYTIVNDYKNKKYSFRKILDSNYLNLALASTWACLYVDACINQNIVGALCDGFLTVHYSLAFNMKRILTVKN